MILKNTEIKNIKTTEIDVNDICFKLYNTRKDVIDQVPQLFEYNPLFLHKKQSGKYKVIDGFLTLQLISAKRKDSTISAYVIDSDTSDLDLWLFRILKRIDEKNFSLIVVVEKLANLIVKYENIIFEKSAFKSIIEKLRIPAHLSVKQLFTSICSKKQAIDNITTSEVLNLKELIQLSKFDQKTLIEIAQLLGELALKGNKLLSCLKMIEELQNGFGISLTTILEDGQIVQIIQNCSENLKYKSIKQRLIELRYPRLTQMQLKWDQNLKKLELGKQISVNIDPYYEDDFLKIEINAASQKQLIKDLELLSKKAKGDSFAGLFELI